VDGLRTTNPSYMFASINSSVADPDPKCGSRVSRSAPIATRSVLNAAARPTGDAPITPTAAINSAATGPTNRARRTHVSGLILSPPSYNVSARAHAR